jgi:hypothetical protein
MATTANVVPAIMNNLVLDFDSGNWVPHPAQKSADSSIDMPQLLQIFTVDPRHRLKIKELPG